MKVMSKMSKKMMLIILSIIVVAVLSILLVRFMNTRKDAGVDHSSQTVSQENSAGTDSDIAIDNSTDSVDNSSIDASRTSEALVDKEEPSVWFFSSETFSWSLGTPYFNPIGDETSLLDLSFEEDEDNYFTYYDNELYEVERIVYGDTWYYSAEVTENVNDPDMIYYVRDLKRHVEDLGGIVEGLHNEGFVFSFVDDEAYHWWGNAEFDHDELSIEIVKENELKINEKLTFKTSDYEDNRIYFTSYNDNKDFLTAVIEIPTGRVDIEIDQDMTKGSYERSFSYDERYDSEIENRYILDDLPKDLGVSYWEIEWNADEDNPQEITIELIDIGDLAKIKYGEDYGGVLISAKYAKRIELRPVGHDNLNLSHPEYEEDSTYLDKTAEGDHLVYVPAGEWVAEIFPTGDAVVSSYATGLIPVNSGEITEIQIPP